MLRMIGKRICEQGIKPFVDPCRADDAGRPEERAKREREPLRGVEEEDGVEFFFAQSVPKGKKIAQQRFFELKAPVEMGIVLEHFHSDGACQHGQVGAWKTFADAFNGGGGPQSVSQGSGCNNEDSLRCLVLGHEGA